MPRWLSEGISVFEEMQENPIWGQTMNPQYRKMVLRGDLTKSCRLSADRTWRLSGQVKVTGGAVLTIEPGTVVQGQVGTPVSFLLIDRGAKILARGTADQPITFTRSPTTLVSCASKMQLCGSPTMSTLTMGSSV